MFLWEKIQIALPGLDSLKYMYIYKLGERFGQHMSPSSTFDT